MPELTFLGVFVAAVLTALFGTAIFEYVAGFFGGTSHPSGQIIGFAAIGLVLLVAGFFVVTKNEQ